MLWAWTRPLSPTRGSPRRSCWGALAYGQLCTASAAFATLRSAPDLARADALLVHAQRELDAFNDLRSHVDAMTELSSSLVAQQKDAFDAFFAAVPVAPWPEAMAYFAFAVPLSADFVGALAPALGPASRDVLLGSVADRAELEAFASGEVRRHLDGDGVSVGSDPSGADADTVDDDADSRHEQLRSLVADLLGRAFTGLQAAMASTDTLAVLLAHHLTGEDDRHEAPARVAKHLAMHTLEGHRRRMHAFGLDDLA